MAFEILERSIAIRSDQKITAMRKISDTEYERYKDCQCVILDFERRHQLFEAIDVNFNTYVNYLCSVVEEHSTKHMTDSGKFEEISLYSNVYIQNFLSTCKALVDHARKLLTKKFGEKSDELTAFDSSCHQEFDNKFSYKFLEGLRGYCQHRSMPNLHCSIAVRSQPDGSREYSVEMLVSRDQMLEDKKIKSEIRKAISSQPQKFDITPLMFDYYKSFKSIYINHLVKMFHFDEVIKSKSYISSLFQVPNEEGIPCIVTGSVSDKKLDMEVEPIPINIIKKVEMVETWLKT